MNGQIQYGSARLMTSLPTQPRRRPRFADPSRFTPSLGASRSMVLLLGGTLILGGALTAVPREIPGAALATVLGGAWLSLVLALTLPSRSERAGTELARRVARFRHELNAIGDEPTREDLEALLQRARELDLGEGEIGDELAQLRASIGAIDLVGRLADEDLPVVGGVETLAPGDTCHYSAPARLGRRRSDQFGHLILTRGWLKFRGAQDVSLAWSEVSDMQRAGSELIVSLHDSKRVLRFTCQNISEAARAGVLAQYLAQAAEPRVSAAEANVQSAIM